MPPKAATAKKPPAGGKKTGKAPPSAADAKKSAANSAAAAAAAAAAEEAAHLDGGGAWLATDALQKTKAMRNYFQLERDRIVAFWEVTRRQLDESRDRLREREQDRAELTERQEIEKKVFKQKIQHLLYENQLQVSSLKEEAERALLSRGEEHRQLENNARRGVRDAKLAGREAELRHREQRMALVAEHDRAIAEQQSQFERELKEIHLKFEQQIRTLREDMDAGRKEELRQVERRKEQHVGELRDVHERTFREMKDYYSEITSNNLEMIRTLKDEVYARKRTEAHNEKAMFEVAQRNKKLTEPLAALQRQRKDLELALVDYPTDRDRLQLAKAQTREAEQEFQTFSWEHEVMSQRHGKLVEDRDIILAKYNAMLQDIQRKSTFRRVLLQKKLELVHGQLEGRDAKLTELLKRANINADDIKELEQKVHDLLSEKDKTIEDLKALLIRQTGYGEDIVGTYESYLVNNGVSGLATGGATVTGA